MLTISLCHGSPPFSPIFWSNRQEAWGGQLGVKRKSLFFWLKSLIFFVLSVSGVWKKKTRKCVVLFFVTRPTPQKKRYAICAVLKEKKASYAFFVTRPTLFLVRDLLPKKKRVSELRFKKKKEKRATLFSFRDLRLF